MAEQAEAAAAALAEKEQQEVPAREQQEVREKEHQRELHLFNQIATITAHSLDFQEIINKVLTAVLEFFQIEAGLLLLWDRGTPAPDLCGLPGLSPGVPGGHRPERPGGVVGSNLSRAVNR